MSGEPATDARYEMLTKVVARLAAGITNVGLYGDRHPVTQAGIVGLRNQLQGLFGTEDGIKVLALGDDLFVNTLPMRRGSAHASALLQRFRKAGVQQVRFDAAVREDELVTLLTWLTAGKAGTESPALPHVHFEWVRGDHSSSSPQAPSAPHAAQGRDAATGIPQIDLGTLHRVNEMISDASLLNMETIEELVYSFLSNIRSEISPLLLLTSAPNLGEYSLHHQRNVCLLGLEFARYLGISSSSLIDFGAALMLHDAGKLAIPPSLLHKKGALTAQEWGIMKLHPVTGANMLLRTPNAPPLAVVAALEHHVQFDMKGYPQLAQAKRPNVCSQICGLSDFYDALRCERPFRAPLTEQEIQDIMLQQSGTRFDPYLVDNFLRMLGVDA